MTPGGTIDILDWLGLKGEDWSEFSDFFEKQLLRALSAPDGASKDALLLELAQRTQRFVDRRGDGELVRALEAWVFRTPDLVGRLITTDFQDVREFHDRLEKLERRDSGGSGLRTLENALYCMGILPERLYPARHEQDPRTALPAMLDVLWPMTAAEDALHGELAGLIEAEPWRPRWELFSLRAFAMAYLITLASQRDEAASKKLSDRVERAVTDRAHGTLGPPNVEQFLAHRSNEYFRVVKSGGPVAGISPTAFVGGAFAWYCKRTLSLPVRLIGAREWAIAYRRLESMIEAHWRIP